MIEAFGSLYLDRIALLVVLSWDTHRVPYDVRAGQEDRGLRVSLPRRERPRGRTSRATRGESAGSSRRSGSVRDAGCAGGFGSAAFATVHRVVELLSGRDC